MLSLASLLLEPQDPSTSWPVGTPCRLETSSPPCHRRVSFSSFMVVLDPSSSPHFSTLTSTVFTIAANPSPSSPSSLPPLTLALNPVLA